MPLAISSAAQLGQLIYSFVFASIILCVKVQKVTKFCEISTVDLTVTSQDKSTVEISQTFVAFSEYMNFKNKNIIPFKLRLKNV